MRFRRDAQLDTSQVSDRRRVGAAPVAAGGLGIVGLLVVLAISLLGGGGSGTDPFSLGTGTGTGSGSGAENDLSSECQTGADADQNQDCRIVAVVNSVQEHWADAVQGYQEADTVLFTGQVSTACGRATSSVGPFYCPADATVYIDLSFYDELQQRFGAQGGPFAEAYVVAHEYGHHVQHLLGADERVGNDREGAESGSVRLELQADCYAGVWAAHAEQTKLIEELTDADIASGLDAASVIGDDYIQSHFGGGVDPDSWTHGSSEQRQRWFTTGYRTGDPNRCDTFSAASL
jgi:predicted metalloprotease